MSASESEMNREVSGVELHLDEPSDVLLIAFGGLGLGVGMPPFEFTQMLAKLDRPVKSVLVRDIKQVWYHAGVMGVGDGVEEVAQYLRRLVEDVSPRRVATLGNSMGGYAALLFGHLIEASAVLAFRPQTFLTDELRRRYGEQRYQDAFDRLEATGFRREFGDLRDVLAQEPSAATIAVHYRQGSHMDQAHARHIEDLPQVEIHGHASPPRLVRMLRDSGRLVPMIEAALGSPAG